MRLIGPYVGTDPRGTGDIKGMKACFAMLLETYALTLAMLLETHALTLRRGTGDIKGMKTCLAMLLETYDKVDDYARLIEFGAQVFVLVKQVN
jgi:hypothetical protein